MALFDELVAEVYVLTKRPDLVAETKTSIKSATIKAHQAGYWDRDLLETGVDLGEELYIQQFQYSALLPRWRAAKYFRKWSGVNGEPGTCVFDIVTPDAMFDAYQVQRDNVAYLAGENFNLRSYSAFRYLLIGAYLNPSTVEAAYSSWIAEQHPFAILHEAARMIFKMIGSDAEAGYYQQLRNEEYANLQLVNNLAKGY